MLALILIQAGQSFVNHLIVDRKIIIGKLNLFYKKSIEKALIKSH